VLVVDLDGEPLAPLRALEEILLCLGTWEDDDRADPGTDTKPLPLPTPLAGRGLAAVQRLLSALAPTSPGNQGAAAARRGHPLRARADDRAYPARRSTSTSWPRPPPSSAIPSWIPTSPS
jgi:hypothetical protein